MGFQAATICRDCAPPFFLRLPRHDRSCSTWPDDGAPAARRAPHHGPGCSRPKARERGIDSRMPGGSGDYPVRTPYLYRLRPYVAQYSIVKARRPEYLITVGSAIPLEDCTWEISQPLQIVTFHLRDEAPKHTAAYAVVGEVAPAK